MSTGEKNAPPRPATSSELMLDALARVQESTQAHRELLHDLRGIIRQAPARLERKALTASEPLATIEAHSSTEAVAVLNFSASTVQLGVAGRSANAGNGLPLPAHTFLLLPVRTNMVDVGADPADLTSNGEADIIVLLFDQPQPLAAGPLLSSVSVQEGVPTISDTTYDTSGNLTAWTQDGVAYVATYDANNNLLTQGPA